MNITKILSSFNFVTVIAFFITLSFIIYEVYLFKKETLKKAKPQIPEFKGNTINLQAVSTKVISSDKVNVRVEKPSVLPIIIGFVFLIIFAFVSMIGIFVQKNKTSENTKIQPTPIIDFVSSKGVKIFTPDWKEISNDILGTLTPDTLIIIGVETIDKIDIDKARIRVNNDKWLTEATTVDFNKEKRVYYKEYVISTSDAELRIEAQLHSRSDGWLGD